MSSFSSLSTYRTRTIESHPLHYKILNFIYRKQAIHNIYFCDIWSEFLLNTKLNVTETDSMTPKKLRHIFYNDILKNIYLYSDIRVSYAKFRYFQFIHSSEIGDLISSQRTDTSTDTSAESDDGDNAIRRTTINNDEFDRTTITRETISEFKQTFNKMFIDPATTNNPATDRNSLRVFIENTGEDKLSIIQHAIFSASFEYESVASKLETCPSVAFASYYLSNELERQQFIYHTIDEIRKRIKEKRQHYLEFSEKFQLNENGLSIAEYLLQTINVHLIDDNDTTDDILHTKHFRKVAPSHTYDPLKYSDYYKSIVKERITAIRLNKGADVAPTTMKNLKKTSNISTTTTRAGKKIKQKILTFSRNKRRIKYSSKSFLQRTSNSLSQTELSNGGGGGGTTDNVNNESRKKQFLPATTVSITTNITDEPSHSYDVTPRQSGRVSEISSTPLKSRLNILRKTIDIITE